METKDGTRICLGAAELQQIFNLDNAETIKSLLNRLIDFQKPFEKPPPFLNKKFNLPPNVGSGVQPPNFRRRTPPPPPIKKEKQQLRPCYANEKKALFHRWIDKDELLFKFNAFLTEDEIVKALENFQTKSILPNCAGFEKTKTTLAIVEYEDGTIDEVRPQQIRFTDNKINEYAFEQRTV